MITPPSNPEEHDPLCAALRRDAARVQEPPFNPALHRATIKRIHTLSVSIGTRWNWRWKPMPAGAAALAVLALCAGLWIPRASQNTAQHSPPPQPDFAAVLASTQAAVANLSSGASSPLPTWMSPTAALLDPPNPSSINPNHQP